MKLYRRLIVVLAALPAAWAAIPAAVAHPHHDIVAAVSHTHWAEWAAAGLLGLAVLLLVRRRFWHRGARHDGA